ncbi:hypothetical protein [Bradyrhizobium sp. I71]|uniref:hypothetical protein n=1 Tax=Bradyrhizobium sp. I71 TaxID=2590772 RepID=UPI001EF8D54D|nr:hypothetical protein [Bradyrhizobium sp. I71]ULK95964.1 hypothetical protein FJV43_24800 [Bradyrhizobium sp. I71]
MKHAIAAAALVLCASPQPAMAGGTCILRPQPFTLKSETVRWSFKIKPGAECIQGLRWSTIMIDNIKIIEPPKSGRLVIQGPAFRYFASADAQGTDSFKIEIAGASLHVGGTSLIEVDITSQ